MEEKITLEDISSPLSAPLSERRDIANLAKAVENLVKKQDRLETRLDVMFSGINPRLENRLDALLTSILECLNQNTQVSQTPMNSMRADALWDRSLVESAHTDHMPTPRSIGNSTEDSTIRTQWSIGNSTPRVELNCSKPVFHHTKAVPNPEKQGYGRFDDELKDREAISSDLQANSVLLEEKARQYKDPLAHPENPLRPSKRMNEARTSTSTYSNEDEYSAAYRGVAFVGECSKKSTLVEGATSLAHHHVVFDYDRVHSAALKRCRPNRGSQDLGSEPGDKAEEFKQVSTVAKQFKAKNVLQEMSNLKKRATKRTTARVSETMKISRAKTTKFFGGSITGDIEDFGILGRILLNGKFDWLCSMIILINSLLIGAITEHLTDHDQEDMWMKVAGYSCNAFFLIELLMRMSFLGKEYFFCQDRLWNAFDFSIVLFSVIDFVMEQVDQEGSASVGSGMKIIKMLRIVRIFRVFRFFRELALLALMIADSIRSLMWALVTLFIIMYVFGICFTSSATIFLKDKSNPGYDPSIVHKIEKSWGTLARSLNSLVQSMLGGVSWGEISDPLFSTGWLTGVFFFFYIFFTMLAVLNIITGVFVDNAVETAKTQREFLVQKEMELKEKYLGELRELFYSMDKDGSGSLTMEEIQEHFADIRVRTYFQVLGMDPNDIERLFRLIDQDDSGEVEVQEFLDGCLRLKGEARSIDVHTVMYDCKACLRELMVLVERMSAPTSRISVEMAEAASAKFSKVRSQRSPG